MTMEGSISYSLYKAIEFVGLFGLAIAFGLWQIRLVNKASEEAKRKGEE
jgi:hypothetical protein